VNVEVRTSTGTVNVEVSENTLVYEKVRTSGPDEDERKHTSEGKV
jgi:hypothetical protein